MIATRTLGPVACDARVWRLQGNLRVTVAIKATFELVHRSPARLRAPLDLVRRDVSFDRDPAASVERAADLVPLRLHTDLTFVGHAHAAAGRPVPAMAVRLALFGERALVDKTLQVFGDRADAASAPAPFVRMPIRFERGGRSARPANLIDPRDPSGAAGFGPERRDSVGVETSFGDGGTSTLLDLPPHVDWSDFSSAPVAQRAPYLRGDEWIVLDGLHPTLARLETQLPSARGVARVVLDGHANDLELQADTLTIDGDLGVCSVVWRGRFAVADLASLGRMTLLADVETSERRVAFPSIAELHLSPAIETDLDATAALTPEQQLRLGASRAVPFTPDAPADPTYSVSPARPEQQAAPHHLRSTAGLSFGEQKRAEQIPATPFERSLPPAPPPRAAPPSVSTEPPSAPSPVSPPPRARFVATDGDLTRACPPRTSPAIPVFNASALVLFTLVWQVSPPQDSLTVVVKATCDLRDDTAAQARAESELPMGDVHRDDDPKASLAYASDFAIFKPRADVTLVGAAYGGATGVTQVTFAFGHADNRFERTIAVFGERRFRTAFGISELTPPERFTKIALVPELAFGGPGFDDNPLGAGVAGGVAAADLRVPNLEDPTDLITSPRSRPAPACFAPIRADHKERRTKLGTYDAQWLKTRWPYFPEDFDWGYFQGAPRAQQLKHLRGDEPFELFGMRPDLAPLRGRLPGIRPRCLLEEVEGKVREITLRLDTVSFDVEAMKVNLVWRGVVEVADDEASDVRALMLSAEDLAEDPAPIEHVRAACLAPKRLPPAEAPPAPAPANEVAPEDPEVIKLRADMDARIAAAKEQFAKAGMPVPDLDAPPGPPPSPAPLDAKVFGERLRAAKASDEEVKRLTEAIDAANEANGEAERGPVPVDHRARVIAMLERGASFEGEDLGGADLSGLDFAKRRLARAKLDKARLVGANFAGADLTSAQLGGADLTDATLEEANLAGADLHQATLDGAKFDGATLVRAKFTGASGKRASFRDAKGAAPSFAGGTWSEAHFERAALPGADFTRATLDGASFVEAVMPEVRLFDARGADVRFDGARMPGARADAAAFPGANFSACDATRSIWEGATLDGACFRGAKLAGASFVRAACEKAIFSAAEMSQARCSRARLEGAELLKTNLMAAALDHVDLRRADLRGANLYAAETWKAKLDGAKLDLAIVAKSKLARRG